MDSDYEVKKVVMDPFEAGTLGLVVATAVVALARGWKRGRDRVSVVVPTSKRAQRRDSPQAEFPWQSLFLTKKMLDERFKLKLNLAEVEASPFKEHFLRRGLQEIPAHSLPCLAVESRRTFRQP